MIEALIFGLMGLLVLLIVLALPIAILVMAILAYFRSRDVPELVRRVRELEWRLQAREGERTTGRASSKEEEAREVDAAVADFVSEGAPPMPPEAAEPVSAEPVIIAAAAASDESREGPIAAAPAQPASLGSAAIDLEYLIGRRALAWIAGLLLLLAAGFFLQYAYQNEWIGPNGQVALVLAGGCGVALLALRHHGKGWRFLSLAEMSAALVIIFLAVFGAFGFYRLVPQPVGGLFLLIVVVEAALLALAFDSTALAAVALAGGLITPLLLPSPRDLHEPFFIYLGLLAAGAVSLVAVRGWRIAGTLAFLGSQLLFWMWYEFNYHPEKFGWSLGLQAWLLTVFLGEHVYTHLVRKRRAGLHALAMMIVVPVACFAAFYALAWYDYRAWMGVAAIGMATLYAAVARYSLKAHPDDERQLAGALALAIGFVALAIPLEADARWVALGWTATAAALWWLALRIDDRWLLVLAGVLGAVAAFRIVVIDTPYFARPPFTLVFNGYALPSLLAGGAFIASAWLSEQLAVRRRVRAPVGALAAIAGVAGIGLVWWVLSVDAYQWFFQRASMRQGIGYLSSQLEGQLALSVLWSVFATVLLALGFAFRRSLLRWLALALYALTVYKAFVFDLAQFGDLFRIVAFFVLAVLLGAAAWAYHRFARPRAGQAARRE